MVAMPHPCALHRRPRGRLGWRLLPLAVALAGAAAGAAENPSPTRPQPVPLPTAGSEHAAVVHALQALARGESQPLLALPGHDLAEAPAIVDPDDAALARRWTALLPLTIARLPPARQAPVLTALDEFYAQARAQAHDHGDALPWDYLPAPTASRAVAQAAARAFDQGHLRVALSLLGDGPQARAAQALLALPLPRPALPVADRRQAPAPGLLQAGDGWLFGLDPAGRVRWQRRCERQAQIVVGEQSAVIVETAGAAVIDGDGRARALPPLPAFARPWAISAGCVWFVAGTRAWRVVLGTSLAVTELTLPAAPLGPPLLRGDDAWWLTREALVMTHGTAIVESLPHLLALSPLACLVAHPQGGEIRDGQDSWLVAERPAVAQLKQGEAWLLAGEPLKAAALAESTGLETSGPETSGPETSGPETSGPETSDARRDLAFRCALALPATTGAALSAAATTPQQQVSAWLARSRRGEEAAASAAWAALAEHAPTLLITDAHTPLTWPTSAWPLQTTLRAWMLREDGQPPQISLSSDARQVRVHGTWADTARWWRRSWPTRPLIDAPSRSWALQSGMLVIADGAAHLVVLVAATGELLVDAEVPVDPDPALVVPCGPQQVALLGDQGRTLLVVQGSTFRRVALAAAARSLRAEGGAVVVTTAAGEQRITPPSADAR